MNLLFILIWVSFARAGLHCADRGELRGNVKSCEQNSVYSDSARRCLEKYDLAVKLAQAELAKELAKLSSADRQAQGLDNADRGYRAARERLDSLVAEGKLLQAQVKAYKEEVVWPEDFTSASEAGVPAETFLGEQPCYFRTQKLLDSYAELLGLHARQVQLTAVATKGLAARSKIGESKLDAGTAVPVPAKSTHGKGSGTKSKSGKSDITGVKKEKKTP